MLRFFRACALMFVAGWISSLALWDSAMAEEIDADLIAPKATWKYRAEAGAPAKAWNTLGFDAAKWQDGKAGFGYGDNDDETVLADMRGKYTTVYVRKEFQIDTPEEIKELYLYMNFDDGFVAYLNGQQVSSAGVINNNGKLIIRLHEALAHEEFVIEKANELIKKGTNVLAISGHNSNASSSDFSLHPYLSSKPLRSRPTRDEYLADLVELTERLKDQSSYLTLRDVDTVGAIESLRNTISDETTIEEFALGVRRIVMQLGDCHADVTKVSREKAPLYLPICPADVVEGVAALSPVSGKLIDQDYPLLTAIDGVDLQKWLDAASHYVSQGSPQLIRTRSFDWLGKIRTLRNDLDIAQRPTVDVTLTSLDGEKTTNKTARVTSAGYRVAEIGLGTSRLLADGQVGYLRIPLMRSGISEIVVKRLASFRDTSGLIIDVRDNRGGSYELLRKIYGYFVAEDATPYISNIAAYRLSDLFQTNHIAGRPTFRANWDGWSEAERQSIAVAAAAFTPEWTPPADKFSDWHYMALSRKDGGQQDYFHYSKPVIVLCNSRSFSATDGFLGAFADLPQVTLMGEPSGGGSGSRRRTILRNSQLTLELSSMASFRANGKLFEGNGIPVDVTAQPTLDDMLGKSDSVLDAATKRLTK